MQKTTRALGTLDYKPQTKQTIKIDPMGVLLDTVIDLEFTVTNTATSPAGLKAETLARLITNLEFTLAGADTFINIPLWLLSLMRWHEREGLPVYGMEASVVTTASEATTYRLVFHIPHWLSNGRRAEDTAVDLRDGRQLTLSATWGNVESLFGTANGATISDVTCRVGGKYAIDVPAEAQFLLRSLTTVSDNVTATNTTFDLEISPPSEGQGLRNLMLVQVRDDVLVNDIVTDMDFKSGTFSWQKNLTPVFFADMTEEMRLDPANLKTGVIWVRPQLFNQLPSAINLGGLTSDLDLILNVTSTSGVEEIIAVRETFRQPFI